MAKMSGGEALVKSLVGEGVNVVFGIPGIQTYGIIGARWSMSRRRESGGDSQWAIPWYCSAKET